jgi:hypothetical protein
MVSILAAVVLATTATPSFDDIIQTKLKDLTLSARVQKVEPGELRSISRDFAEAYRFTSSNVWYRSPGKLRLEGTYKNAKITYIISGAGKWIIIPQVKLKQHFNLETEPGKRQSMLDFGIIDRGVADFMKGEFVRVDRSTGDWVFDLRFQYRDDTTRHRVWISPTTKAAVRREWYGQDGRLKATFYYSDIKNYEGVFIPTTIEVRNVAGKTGGVTVYDKVRANTGTVPDSLFSP